MNIKSLKNYIGYQIKRKIVVIESDDWGSIRMPSTEAYENLKSKGLVKVDYQEGIGATNNSIRYDRYDTLANNIDLKELFDVLHTVKDFKNNPVKFTPVAVVANPDYEKIKQSNFKEYHYELFTDKLKKNNQTQVLDLWKKGVNEGFFKPQYHGREHLNVAKWMKALQSGHKETHLAFEQEVYGITFKSGLLGEDSYLAAYDFSDPSEISKLEKITVDGLNKFESIFGFRANYFVPPNGPLSSKLNQSLAENGIDGIQTARFIYNEPIGFGKTKKRIRYFGMKTKFNQVYTLRNAIFEPNEPANFNWNDKCLNDIDLAFRFNKPAVISTHRVNYIGALVSENRTKSLESLERLLKQIINKWPDVEFMTSDELVNLMLKK